MKNIFILGMLFNLIFLVNSALGQMDHSGHHDHDQMKKEEMKIVKLSPQQIKLANVQSMPLQKHFLFKEIRATGQVAYDPEMQIAQQEYFSADEQNKY